MFLVGHISEEERLEIYDRLATKWALKMEAKKANRHLLRRYPSLKIRVANPLSSRLDTGRTIFMKEGGSNAKRALTV